ncbi:MAG: MYG1 family protein [bacterium]|nr:MYG1 family protein [bacterium]
MMSKKVVIATHNGMFHSDDVFAVAALLFLLETTPAITTIVRTRDEDLIRKADFVVDVGAVYDADKNRFDHHQEGGAGERDNKIKYAAFGLVWKKYGVQVTGSEAVAMNVERNLVIPVDAGDNGMDIYKKTFADVSPYCVDDFIHNLRPTWQEGMDSLDTKFLEAVAVAGQVLKREVAHAKAQADAEVLVRKSYDGSSDKRLIVLDAFYPHEKTLGMYPEPLFVVFPRPDGSWNIKAIRDDSSSFKNRKDLPLDWAGKRDIELAAITGVPDAFFCHNGRFMAAAKSKEGALALAELALATSS